MKKKLIAAAIAVLSVGLLASCSLEDAYNFIYFIENAEGYAELPDEEDDWWDYEYDDDDYYGDDDDDDGRSSSSKNNNNSSSKNNNSSSKNNSKNSSNNGGGTSGETVTTDNPYFEFRWTESDHTASVRFMSGAEISEITIPSSFYRDGVNYRIINDDYEPGLGYKMDVTRIVLPEGFEEISLGFAHDMNLVSVKLPSTIKKIGNSILVGCNNFKTIEYNGTKAQWEAIDKKVWDDRLPVDITIACKDGNITVPRDSSWD